ncbi:MAG: acyl-CoA dehydrogenase family protein [Bauldia sp.]|nr:acyl-CoA dehydrogenase family protein [Bauldia sp.]MCW5718389.1 acyl-CoA dehydrogenase family protein [Bauldia sp.]
MSQAFRTHDVTNQPPLLAGTNLFASDPVLAAVVEAIPAQVADGLAQLGTFYGSAEALELGRLANQSPPVLRTHDPRGARLDAVEYHPAYHALMRRSVAVGLHCSVWDAAGAESRFRSLARAARLFLAAQVDVGHLDAIRSTNAAVSALAHSPRLAEGWLPMVRSRKYDQTAKPAPQKSGVLLSIATTEKQAGSDFTLLATRADRDGNDANYRLIGHKWYVTAPMSDALVALAQTREGLSCFLVPRFLADGSRNGIRLLRLKDRLGSRSSAAGEIEFESASGFLLGNAGQGAAAISEVLSHTRLDDAIIAASLMRAALTEAVHHARHRTAGGRKLIDQPLMGRVLADLALDVTAATALAFRVALAADRAADDPVEAAFARLMTPVAKYWIAKAAPAVIAEALECIGGNATVEESRLPRFYRDVTSMMVGDGPGNVLCLDVVKALSKSSEALEAVLVISENALGGTAKATLNILRAATAVALADEGSARVLTEQLALTVAAATLHHSFPAEIGDAFLETRLGKGWRTTYGMLDSRFDARGLLDFVCPEG